MKNTSRTATLRWVFLFVAAVLAVEAATSACSSDAGAPSGDRTARATADGNRAYLSSASGVLDSLVRASSAVSDVLSRPDMASAAWKGESAAAFAAFGPIEVRAAGLTAPPGLEGVESAVLQAARLYRQGADLLSKGIAAVDLDAIAQGADLVSQGVTAIAQASLAIKNAS